MRLSVATGILALATAEASPHVKEESSFKKTARRRVLWPGGVGANDGSRRGRRNAQRIQSIIKNNGNNEKDSLFGNNDNEDGRQDVLLQTPVHHQHSRKSHSTTLQRLRTSTSTRLGTNHHSAVLKNQPTKLEKSVAEGEGDAVECDPTSSSPDVGILSSCGVGKHCMAVDDNDVGGLCVNDDDLIIAEELIVEQRELQGYEAITDLCDPASTAYEPGKCDCSVFDLETNTGTFSCTLEAAYCFPGYDGFCASGKFFFQTSRSVFPMTK